MAMIDSTSLLISLLCLIAVLTSSVSAVAEPDGISSALPSANQNCSSKSSVMTEEHPHSDVTDDKQILKNLTRTSMMAEGGPIPISANTEQQGDTKILIEPDISHKSRGRENMPKERFAAPSIVARKGVEQKKVKARKGVNQSSLDPEQTTTMISQTTLENTKPIVENAATMVPAHADDQPEASNIDTPKSNVNNSRPNNNSDHHGANSSSILIPVDTSTSHAATTNDTTIQKSSSLAEKKHIPKPKPTVTTVGKSEINESRLPLRNKSSLLGKPRKIDYIVPVIITIIALPLLGTAIFLLYRRGRDCWDKRHYRRMDFLIDGMYND